MLTKIYPITYPFYLLMKTLKQKLSLWIEDMQDVFYDDDIQERIFHAISTESEDEMLPEDYELLKKLGNRMMKLSFILENKTEETKQLLKCLQ